MGKLSIWPMAILYGHMKKITSRLNGVASGNIVIMRVAFLSI